MSQPTTQAFEIVARACASVQTDLATHQAIQAALLTLRHALFPEPSVGEISPPVAAATPVAPTAK